MHTIELRSVTDEDFQFTFETKRAAFGGYISKVWGWNEGAQLELHKRLWHEKPWFVIVWNGENVGTVSIRRESDYIQFGEFYILPEFQGMKIGGKVLGDVLKEADEKKLPVRLECLKWNPVVELYKRNKFETVREDANHFFMERQPQPV